MPSIIVPMEDELKERLDKFPMINWSEVAREISLRREIFETYIKTGIISDKDWKFCEKIDWHPVDWLPLKEGFIKELESAKKEQSIKLKSVSNIFEK